MSSDKCDLAIVGSGLTGMSALLAAYNRNPNQKIKAFGIPYDSNTAKKGDLINIPGIEKIVGVDYISNIVNQLFQSNQDASEESLDSNVELIQENVTKVAKIESGFQIITDSRSIESKAVVISTGLPELKGTIRGEDEFVHKGVSHCAVCDGALFRGKKVAIIGRGNFVARGAIFLRKYCRKITLLCPDDSLDCDRIFLDKLQKSPNVTIKLRIPLDSIEISGSQIVEGIKYNEAGEDREQTVNAVFVELKDSPNFSIFKDIEFDLDDEGFLKTDNNNSTNIEGIFAAGTVKGEIDYVPVLMGDGYKAGLYASDYLHK